MTRGNKRSRRLARGAWTAALAGGALLLLLLAASPATEWLLSGDSPSPAELMVILSGGARERVQRALELYRAGMAPVILITDPEGFPDAEMSYLERRGVPRSALLAPLRPATSTAEDAVSVKEVIVRKGFKSILVVTSPSHCRRARLILERVLRTSGIRVTVTPSESLYFDPHRWWTDRQGWANVPPEFPKIAWAWLAVPEGTPVGGLARAE